MELTRAELARQILNADDEVLAKIAKSVKRIISKYARNYYDSPEFYAEIDAAEKEIQDGEYKSVKTQEDLDKLFS